MTDTGVHGKRRSLVMTGILLLTWAIAGVTNANASLMGGTPTAVGIASTLVAICVWPVAGWLGGLQHESSFLRLATVFWAVVALGSPVAAWALISAPGLSVIQGGFLLPLLLFVLAAPLYGLTALMPTWDSFSYETLMWTTVVGAAAFTITMAACLARRRVG